MADDTMQETAAEDGAGSTPEQSDNTSGKEIPAEVQRALRKANKEAETLRLRLKEYEDRDKTELERAVARAEAAEKTAAGHETAALRLAVAFEKGLTPAQAKRLVGTSREDLEADADEVLKDFPAPTARPRGDIGQGTRGKPAPTDPAQVFAQIMRGEST